jgi:hypothetical protein
MQPTRPFTELLKDGPDPIAFFCHLLADESAPIEERKEAARALLPSAAGEGGPVLRALPGARQVASV